jgi:3-oxoacyl-[acyl-carrier protein] reductase
VERFVDLGISGKVAVVCASTAGLGRATAEALAHEGASVVVCGRRGKLAEDIAAELPRAVGVGVDLMADSGVDELLAATEEAFGPADILVLNGPGPHTGRVTDIAEGELEDAVRSLVTVHQRLVSRVLPGMLERGWGRILAFGSSTIIAPVADMALSGVGRTALAVYLKMLATEVAASGVTVNMLLPGRIATDRLAQFDAARAARTDVDTATVKAFSPTGIPARRFGEPGEFGAVAAFLCSDLASYVTGTAVRCDGGMSPVL